MEMIEIIIFAMIAAFVALRLFSVLGRRPEDDGGQQPVAVDASAGAGGHGDAGADLQVVADPFEDIEDDDVREGLREIAKIDRGFDLEGFLGGANGAYDMILEGFWNGDRDAFKPFVSKDIFEEFEGAIEEREANDLTVENKLVDIEKAEIVDARLDGRNAEITMEFVANIIAVTRNADGEVVEGSLSDTFQTRDRWTFSRKTSSRDPNWAVIETESA